jgi:serine/threonine-protein kinase RsbW
MPSEAQIRRSIVVPGTASAVRRVCEQILSQARKYKYSRNDIFAVHLALEEAFINAIRHGNKMDPDKEVKVEYFVTADKVDVLIMDQGRGFDVERVPDPRVGDNLYKTSGRGLLLMRSYMNVVEFNKTGNCVHMVKYKDGKGG